MSGEEWHCPRCRIWLIGPGNICGHCGHVHVTGDATRSGAASPSPTPQKVPGHPSWCALEKPHQGECHAASPASGALRELSDEQVDAIWENLDVRLAWGQTLYDMPGKMKNSGSRALIRAVARALEGGKS